MLLELNELCQTSEEDLRVMEGAVSQHLAPAEISDNRESLKLSSDFDNLYYELAAFADVFSFPLSPIVTACNRSMQNSSANTTTLSMYQLPKRKFSTFSGLLTEWQGFEDLFQSILSQEPDLPDVERFEYLKTSLVGEPLTLTSHLPLTSSNYTKAWEVLRSRYGNKRVFIWTPC